MLFLLLALGMASACGRGKPISVTGTGADGAGGVSPSGDVLNGGAGGPSVVPIRGLLDLKASSDTGQFSDDNITKIHAPQFSVKIDGYVDFSLFANENKIFTGRSDAVGEALISLSPLADGLYQMQAIWVDSHGQRVGTQIVPTCIDTVAPTNGNISLAPGSDSGTSNTDNLTNVTNPTFQIVSTEQVPAGDLPEKHLVRYRVIDGASGGPNVLLIDSFGIDSAFVPPGARNYRLQGPGLADGSHHITLRIEDLAGNAAE